MTSLPTILTTAVSVSSCLALVGLWVFRAIIAKDIQPLSDSMIRLEGSVKALTDTMTQERDARREERDETRKILADLDTIVRNHEVRLSVLEQPSPPTGRSSSARRSRGGPR